MDLFQRTHTTTTDLQVRSTERKHKRRVGGSTVLVGDFTRIACHLLQLLFPALTKSTLVAEHSGPGVFECGAGEDSIHVQYTELREINRQYVQCSKCSSVMYVHMMQNAVIQVP